MDLDHGSGSSKHSRSHLEVGDESGSSTHSRTHQDVGDGSGSSKHSDANLEVGDESGSSRHSRTHQDVGDGSGSSKHSRTHLEGADGSGSSKHSDAHPEVINWSGSNQHQETHLDVNDRSGSSKHSEAHVEVIDRKGSINHSEIDPEIFDGSGSRNHFEIHPEVFDGSGSSRDSETQTEVVDRSDSSKHTLHPQTTVHEGDLPFPTKKLKSSSSSSSSASSLDDLFQVDTEKVFNSAAAKSAEVTQPALNGDKNDVSSNNSSKLEECNNGSTSQVSDITHEPVLHSMSPTQSPPIQMMDRSGGYDPYRIPSSVFSRSKSITPMEWSVTSNESLFSIHVGNNSFSRDQFSVLGDLSGELTKSGELFLFSPHPQIPMVGTDRNSVEMEKYEAARVADETTKDAKSATTEDHSEGGASLPAVSWNSSSISNHSDMSGASTRSFAFPILTEGEKSGSLKADVEKVHLKPPASAATKNLASCLFRCFPSCFRYCRPSCCPSCFTSCRCCSFRCNCC